MASLEDLLRACTVRVVGPRPGAGFFVAPGKVLTCCHVISSDGTEAGVAADLTVVWERDGRSAVTFTVTGAEILESRGRPIPVLDADYPDVAVLEVRDSPPHPCVWLDTDEPCGGSFAAYGYPEEGRSVLLTSVALEYRGKKGNSPTLYTDLMRDTIRPGMSGAAVLNSGIGGTGGVCGIIVASRNPRRPEGGLVVPWAEIDADLGSILEENRTFHDQDLAWAEAAYEATGRVLDPLFRKDLRTLLEKTATPEVRSVLPRHIEDADVLRMSRTVRMLGKVRRPVDDHDRREDAYALPSDRDDRSDAPPQPWNQVSAEHDRLVVLGDPGMGKSWLLLLEAHRLAEAGLAVPGGPAIGADAAVPLLVRADTLANILQAEVPAKKIVPADALAKAAVDAGLLEARSQEHMRNLIAAGGAVLLVDGLDEVPREVPGGVGTAPRKRLEDLLTRWTEEYPGARFIVTSRLSGYTRPVRDVEEAELLPFTRSDIAAAVGAWELPDKASDWLLRQLAIPTVAAMARVPLLLSLICSLAGDPDQHRKNKNLPVTRAELYRKVVDQFLSNAHRADEVGAPASRLNSDEKQCRLAVLAHVAFTFASDQRGWIDRMPYLKLSDAVQKAGAVALDLGDSPGKIIDQLAGKAGILVPAGNSDDENPEYVWLHRTFAEYLVARYLHDLVAESRMEIIAEHQWFDLDWAEVIPMLGGLFSPREREEASALVSHFLTQRPDPLHYAFHTALRILGETSDPNSFLTRDQEHALARKIHRLLTEPATRDIALADAKTWPRAVTEALLEALHDADWGVRRAAAKLLAGCDGDEVTRAFLDLLRNGNRGDCMVAAGVLAGRDGDEVTRALLGLLRDDDWDVRRAAVRALAGRGGDEVTRAFLGLFRWGLGATVVRALAERGGDEATRALVGLLRDHRFGQEAVDALAGCGGDEVTRVLLALLRDGDRGVRDAVVRVLAKREGGGVTHAFLDLLRDGDRGDHMVAVRALARRGGDGVIRALLAALRDGDQGVRDAAVLALAGRAEDEVTRALPDLLRDGDRDVRDAAVRVLAGRESGEFARAFLAELQDHDVPVRLATADVLAGRGGNEVTRALLGLLRNGHWDVRRAAAKLLAGRDGDDVTRAFLAVLRHDDDRGVLWTAVDALAGRGGDEVTHALLAALHHDDSGVRMNAAGALAGRGGDEVTCGLLAALRKGELLVSDEAARALVGRGGDEVTHALLDVLHDANGMYATRAAVDALAGRGGDEVTHALLAALHGDDRYVRRAAVDALVGRGGDEVTHAFLGLLRDGDRDVRLVAVRVLVGRGGDEVTHALLAALRDGDWHVCRAVGDALAGREGSEVTRGLLAALRDGDERVRMVATDALGGRGDPMILSELTRQDIRQSGFGWATRLTCRLYPRIPLEERPRIRNRLARVTPGHKDLS